PTVHQVADLPHQGLVPVDGGLRGFAVFVEARRRHRLLDLADGKLALGDFRLQFLDLGAPSLIRSLTPARLGVGALLGLTIARLIRPLNLWNGSNLLNLPNPLNLLNPLNLSNLLNLLNPLNLLNLLWMLFVPEKLLVSPRIDDGVAVSDL